MKKDKFNMYIENGDNYYRIQNEDMILIFRFDKVYKNTQVKYKVRNKGTNLKFDERKFYNRIDVYQIENGKEIYKTNFNFTNYRDDSDIEKECKNYFQNWVNLNYDFTLMKHEPLPHEKIKLIYEDNEYECLYLSLENKILAFIPQHPNFNTERINVFQITENNHFIYRSNFEMKNIQNKEDFIANCIKYFYIWIMENKKKNSFDKPKFNSFPWQSEIDNAW